MTTAPSSSRRESWASGACVCLNVGYHHDRVWALNLYVGYIEIKSVRVGQLRGLLVGRPASGTACVAAWQQQSFQQLRHCLW